MEWVCGGRLALFWYQTHPFSQLARQGNNPCSCTRVPLHALTYAPTHSHACCTRSMLPRYLRHVEAHPDTLLIRFYGVHRLKPRHGRKVGGRVRWGCTASRRHGATANGG